jgi:hypothetical protein
MTTLLVPYLPSEMRYDIMSQLHDAPESGHMGVKKTKKAVKRRFFWNSMNKDIHEFVKTCRICQEYKVDFIGPLPKSSQKRNKCCLVVIDQLSNWVELFPMMAATAKKVAEKLKNEVFCRFWIS